MKSVALPASQHRWILGILMVLVVSAAMHPIATDELWWQLSRGRAVLNGELAPSRSLLAGDTQGEADWLGGVPIYCLYRMGGFSALMLLKLAVVAGLTIGLWRRAVPVDQAPIGMISVGLILVTAQAAEPTPALWDLLGLLTATRLLEKSRRNCSWTMTIVFGLLVSVWANLAPGFLLVAIPIINEIIRRESPGVPRLTSRNIACFTTLTCLGLCLTPRGPLTIWDSARQLVPILVESPAILSQSPWRPIWTWPFDAMLLGWVLLGLAALIQLRRQSPFQISDRLLFAVVASLGCWSRPNALVLSAWLAGWIVVRRGHPSARSSPAGSSPLLEPRPTIGPRVRWCLNTTIASCICLLSVGLSLGISPLVDSRLGWGIDRRLEIRMLEDVFKLASSRESPSRLETAHCADVRAAGMIAWSGSKHCKPYLVSQRALLNGRLREEVLLNHELKTGWLKQHRRTDGTDGGWWLPFRERNTSLLLLSAEQTRLIQSLLPTIWKPLSLDSPVILYALAGDPRFNARIAEVRSQQELVDRGAWVFQPETPAGNDQLVDWVGWISRRPNPEPILRQSAVLRAMNLPLGSARVLRPLLPIGSLDGKVRQEWIATQSALAEREKLTMGEVGEFRRAVLKSLGVSSSDAVTGETSDFSRAVPLYLAGQTRSAAEQLTTDTPAMMSASAMLEWEAGRPDQARLIWHALTLKFPTDRHALLSRDPIDAGHY